MKVTLVTPQYHQSRGNTITVERISRGLNQLGIRTEVVSITEDNNFPQLPSSDLVHGFNAYQFYRYWKSRGSLSYPYLITLTGTDLNYALFDEKTKKAVIQTLRGSKAIHVFNREGQNLLWREVPGLVDKTFLIPQGVQCFHYEPGTMKKDKDNIIFVLPAGVRSVKNIPAAISMLTSLYEQDSRVRLWIVGPIIEEEEGNKVRRMMERNSHWIHYWGEIPHLKMGEIYQCADIVLNTSLSEGQSSAILEAMCMGIPVLVSDIAGNRDIVLHGKTGYLYSNESEFKQYACQLIEHEDKRSKMGLQGKEHVKNHHSVEEELQALKNIYSKMIEYKRMRVILDLNRGGGEWGRRIRE